MAKFGVGHAFAIAAAALATVALLDLNNYAISDDIHLQIPEGASLSMEIKETEATGFVSLKTSRVIDFNANKFDLEMNDQELLDIKKDRFSYDGRVFYVETEDLKLFDEPSTDTNVQTKLSKGEKLVRISYDDKWSYVRNEKNNEGYVLTKNISDKEVAVPITTSTPTPTPTPKPTSKPTVTPTVKATVTPAEKPAAETTESKATNTPSPEAKATSTSTPTPTPVPVKETKYDTYISAASDVNIRKGPDTTYDLAYKAKEGVKYHVVAKTDNEWYKLEDGNYIAIRVTVPYKEETNETTTATEETSASAEATDKKEENKSKPKDFPSFVKQFLGVKYTFSGSSPDGFDCSGLVKYCFKEFYGITLPHSAHAMSSLGTEIAPENIQVGDCVMFDYDANGRIDHVGIYIGGGTVIHASETKGMVVASSFSGMNGRSNIRRLR